jgi:hypothetical protein
VRGNVLDVPSTCSQPKVHVCTCAAVQAWGLCS